MGSDTFPATPPTDHPNSGQGENLLKEMISVILGVFNERADLENVINSILAQELPHHQIEILVVDGGSTDGSQEILSKMAEGDPRLRLLENPARFAPYAFNIGIRAARGQFLCILGAHTTYPPNYIATCIDELEAHDAAACGGRVLVGQADTSLGARMVSWIMSHSFGSSARSFRTQKSGFVDNVNYAVFRKSAVLDIGLYNEQLHRNQDNDLNYRLRAAGYKLYQTSETSCVYYSKRSLAALLKYAFRNGYWNIISVKERPASMHVFHFIPLAFVLMLGAGVIAAAVTALTGKIWPASFLTLVALLGLGLHLVLGNLSAVQIAIRERAPAALLLAPIFLAFHVSYGIGSLVALLKNARVPRLVTSGSV